jgi:hypothetical protein
MTSVEKWILSINPGVWFKVSPEQAEALKPFVKKYDLTFTPDFTKVRKEYPEEYFKKTYAR